MNLIPPTIPVQVIEYPDDDGLPMANNSQQGEWIVFFIDNLRALLREVVDVYLAVDHLWYPLEGHPDVKYAPDVMVVLGSKRGKRGSYKQWEEDNVPVTIAIEILSPANDWFEMADKLAFYDEYGVQEYYIYDPDSNRLDVYLRQGQALRRQRQVHGFVSPLLNIRFDLSGPELVVYYPDGRRFLTPEEFEAERLRAEQQAKDAQQQAKDAQRQAKDAQRQAKDAQQQAKDAQQQAKDAQVRAEHAEQNVAVLQRRAERQAELMRRVLEGQTTAEELRELQQLLQPRPPAAGPE